MGGGPESDIGKRAEPEPKGLTIEDVPFGSKLESREPQTRDKGTNGHDTETVYAREALAAMNGPNRPVPPDLTPQERDFSNKAETLMKDYYAGPNGESAAALRQMFANVPAEQTQRIADTINAELKSSGIRVGILPTSGDVWLGKYSESAGTNVIGLLLRGNGFESKHR